MILSVSRRTDIPALYLDWFLKRLEEGYVLVRNPMNPSRVSRISLEPAVVDCIVFWTKNPAEILKRLNSLSAYNYYFQITITGYGRHLEPFVPPLERVIAAFKSLSQAIGKEKTIWRYDPVILTDEMDVEFHRCHFARLADELADYTERCVISFLDLYKKTARNMQGFGPLILEDKAFSEVASYIGQTANDHGIQVETCAEHIDLSDFGIKPGKCIDDGLIERILGQPLAVSKDHNQRPACGCVSSIDIGAYNTCTHGCLYCYANYSPKTVQQNIKNHDPNSPLLIGRIQPTDKITERTMESLVDHQMKLF